MSATQYLVDATTRHQVFLQRFANGEAKKAKATLNKLRAQLKARMLVENTQFQRNRLSRLLFDIDQLYKDFAVQLNADLSDTVKQLVVDEADYTIQVFNKAANVSFASPSDEFLAQAVLATSMSVSPKEGDITIQQAIEQFAGKKSKQVSQLIRDSIVLGDTTPEITKKIVTMTNTLHRREVTTVVHTAINHASSVARAEVYKANDDLIEGYEFVATLDGRTSLVCAGLDGKVFRTGEGPVPVLHYNCRSTTIPRIISEYQDPDNDGTRPAIGADGVEQVSANQSYGTWLKRQPKEFVDEALGLERSKLFRSGELTIDKFTDPLGRTYSLTELKALNGIAL